MFIRLFIIALSSLFLIDMVWLLLLARKLYNEMTDFLMKTDVSENLEMIPDSTVGHFP